MAIQQMGHVRANALKHTTGVIYQAGPGLVEYDRTTKSRIVLFRNDSSVP